MDSPIPAKAFESSFQSQRVLSQTDPLEAHKIQAFSPCAHWFALVTRVIAIKVPALQKFQTFVQSCTPTSNIPPANYHHSHTQHPTLLAHRHIVVCVRASCMLHIVAM
eukprot:1397451-Amphidinium_carterae.1